MNGRKRSTTYLIVVAVVIVVVVAGIFVIRATGRKGADTYQSAAQRTLRSLNDGSRGEYDKIAQPGNPGAIDPLLKLAHEKSKFTTKGYGITDQSAAVAIGELIVDPPGRKPIKYWLTATHTTGTLLGRSDGWFVTVAPAK